jgi:hypothetical protein
LESAGDSPAVRIGLSNKPSKSLTDSKRMASAADTDSPEQCDCQPDRRLRALLFWIVMSLAGVIGLISRYCEHFYSYDLNFRNPATGQKTSRPLPYGSYGFLLGKIAPTCAGRRKVVLLGNSVYQTCGVVEWMQERANAEDRRIDFYNLAMTGSGIHDYLVELAKVVRHKPDLVVISFINWAFTTDVGGKEILPRFRTDAEQMAFDPDVVRVLPLTFYRREFTLDRACGAAVSWLLPLKRLDPMVRRDAQLAIARWLPVPQWFWMHFDFPTLNLAADWMKEHRLTAAPCPAAARAYPETHEVLDELVEVAHRHQVPVLFIRQESGPAFAWPDVMPELHTSCRNYAKAFLVDRMHYYSSQQFPDQVHPAPAARAWYAQEHYRVIRDVLDRLQAKE